MDWMVDSNPVLEDGKTKQIISAARKVPHHLSHLTHEAAGRRRMSCEKELLTA
jgi:hypothetical protein